MNKLYKNWGYLLFSNAFSTGIGFFTFVFLARKLSPDGYGEFSTLIAAVTLFSTLANNIVSGTVVNREIVTQPGSGKDLVKKAIYLRALGFLIASIALIIYQYFIGKNEGLILIYVIVLLLANIAWELFEQIAFGFFVTKITTLLKISLSIIWLVAVVITPLEYSTVILFFSLYSIITLISSICYWLFDIKLLSKKDEKSNVSTKQLIGMSMPYLWMRILGAFGDQVPILLLSGYSGTAQVAYYSVGYKFVLPITLMINTGISAIFPYLTKLYREDIELFKEKVGIGLASILILGSTAAAFLTATSSYWLIWILGKGYTSSVEAFNYQVWFAVCLGFDLILSMVFSSSYRQNVLAIITMVDIVILLPIMFFALPYGAKGVAIAKLVGVIISIFYHIIVAVFFLKIKLNNSMFILSCCYFLILINISMFIAQIWVKISLLIIIMTVFIIIKRSPVRRLLVFLKDKLWD